MKRFFCLLLVFILTVPMFCSCGKDDLDVVTGVTYTVYELDGSDMISFYMTSDQKVYGDWSYSIDESGIFEVFLENRETKEYGKMKNKGVAVYSTLILKPMSEGEGNISFTLSAGDMKYEYKLSTSKDENGIMRIKAEEIK